MKIIASLSAVLLLLACQTKPVEKSPPSERKEESESSRYDVIFDTDANNELDDQHALAYLLLNEDVFNIRGITVNATKNGGDISGHYAEAERVLTLCNRKDKYPLLQGANGGYEEIVPQINQDDFDGAEAVNFIIDEANKSSGKLVLIPVGKLTNIALALHKEPSIAEKVRIVWLGSNYPKPGEYNQDNDIPSMNYVLGTAAPFEMVTVRYGEPSGTAAVTVTKDFINEQMPNLGPTAAVPVTGRHGGTYQNFGDYTISLFEHIDYHGNTQERALFDLAAVAIIKNPQWAEVRRHPCPIFKEGAWIEQPGNEREILIWENFNRDAIIEDFMNTLKTGL